MSPLLGNCEKVNLASGHSAEGLTLDLDKADIFLLLNAYA